MWVKGGVVTPASAQDEERCRKAKASFIPTIYLSLLEAKIA